MDEDGLTVYMDQVEEVVNRRFYYEEGIQAGIDQGYNYRNPYNRIHEELEHDCFERGFLRGKAIKRQSRRRVK